MSLVLPYIGYSGETADFLALIEKSNDSQREEAMRSLTSQSRRLVAQIDNLEKLSEGTYWQNINVEQVPFDVFDIIFCAQETGRRGCYVSLSYFKKWCNVIVSYSFCRHNISL